MGFPVYQILADSMGVPVMMVLDAERLRTQLGNAMHTASAGVALLIALSCFAPKD